MKVIMIAGTSFYLSFALICNTDAADPGDARLIGQYTSDNNTVLLLHMNESGWNGTLNEVVDSSSYGNHGTAGNDATTTTDGKLGRAGTFDGRGDYVNCSNNTSLSRTGDMTVEAWVKTTYDPGEGLWQNIVTKGSTDVGVKLNYQLWIRGGNNIAAFDIWDGTVGPSARGTSTINDGEWHHLAGTVKKGGVMSIYVDGILEGTTRDITGDSTNSAGVMIGTDISAAHPFKGTIDEVRISNKVRSFADSATQVQLRLEEARAQLARTKSLISANPQLAEDDYIQLGVAIAERFIRRVETGGPNGKQPLDWSSLQVNEVKEVLAQTEDRIKRALASKSKAQVVAWPTGGPVTVRDGIFYTDTTAGKGSSVIERPCFFGGYGVFEQVAADIPNFRNLGVTLVSQQRGPRSINSDGSLNDDGRSILNVFKSAAENGIKVDLLLSPHYFPHWAIDQAPDVRPDAYVGFPTIIIDHPKAREVIQKWLETIVSEVKDEPALFSFCLANEPDNHDGGRDPYSRPRWIEYLKQQHSTVESLNALYGTNYKSFEDVPPGTQAVTEVGSKRAYYDWLRFNQYHFAGWFRWMNDIIKRIAPDVPTHIKVTANDFFLPLADPKQRDMLGRGVCPELSEVTDLAGNDCAAYPGTSWSDWISLLWEELLYDLWHSVSGQPVINTENHFIADDSPAVSLPPSHIRSVLWQGALHHQGATTLWVWEEPSDSVLRGSIYLRPANIYAAGQTMLDLNRLAPEVAAASQAKSKVALLYSVPSYFWQEDDYLYLKVMKKVYAALVFMGQPVTFVSEQQLAEGSVAKVDWIILTHTTHVYDATVAALEKFMAEGGRVVRAGNDCLAWDEYHRERTLPVEFNRAAKLAVNQEGKAVAGALKQILVRDGLTMVDLYNTEDNRLAWDIEYRVLPYKGRMLISMMNFLHRPQTVKLSLKGNAVDLLSGRPVDLGNLRLNSSEPVFLEVNLR